MLLARDPDDPSGVEGDQRVLAQVKSNLGPLAPSLRLRIEEVPNGELRVARIVDDGISPYTGTELLAIETRSRGSKRAEAIAFLEEQLADGPKPAGWLQDEAARLGIAEMTLSRAKSDLGIRSTKADFGGGWIWALPVSNTQAA